MGTLGNGLVHQLHKTDNTTVDAISMHKTLAGFVEREVSHVCMEVSSHALTQGRVNGVLFNTAVFTNLTRDHLDYHGTMEEYLEAKKQLLIRPELKSVIINGDDAYGNRLLDDETIMADKFSFSITPVNARIPERSVWTERVKFKDTGMEADVTTPWGNVTFETHLIGQFNLSNCLAVLTTLGAMGYDIEQVAAKLANLKSVAGRMERFGGEDKPLVIVDYAHTPDALSHVLSAIKPHTSHRLWCIFGCGGDRDRGKRPLMAKAAEQYADYIVITSDNPRSEPVETITQEIIDGLEHPAKCEIEYDRERAIQSVISRAVLGDVILVAGKGHEDYQIIGDERRPFSDAEAVKLALSKGSWS